MTDEQIKELAKKYAEYKTEPFDDAHDEIALEYFKDTIAFLRWLYKTHCIVKKEEVKSEFAYNRRLAIQFSKGGSPMCDMMKEWHQGKCDELISLFGTALFNEEKE